MEYGEQLINGGWYYFDTTSGAMATGWKWLDDGQKMVYYGDDGRMYPRRAHHRRLPARL